MTQVSTSLYCLFQYKMNFEQTMKDLQTQNSQFQETLLNLAKGKQEMMSLLVPKQKTKKKAVINMGKRFKGPAR